MGGGEHEARSHTQRLLSLCRRSEHERAAGGAAKGEGGCRRSRRHSGAGYKGERRRGVAAGKAGGAEEAKRHRRRGCSGRLRRARRNGGSSLGRRRGSIWSARRSRRIGGRRGGYEHRRSTRTGVGRGGGTGRAATRRAQPLSRRNEKRRRPLAVPKRCTRLEHELRTLVQSFGASPIEWHVDDWREGSSSWLRSRLRPLPACLWKRTQRTNAGTTSLLASDPEGLSTVRDLLKPCESARRGAEGGLHAWCNSWSRTHARNLYTSRHV